MKSLPLACWIVRRSGDFVRDQRGVIAIMFGLALLPLALAVGTALDYNNSSRLRNAVSAAADAAALAGVKSAADYVNINGSGNNARERARLIGEQTAAEVFRNNLAAFTGISLDDAGITITVGRRAVEAVVNGSGRAQTTVLQVVGVRDVPVRVQSRAEQATRRFTHLAFLLDVSQSMGIGATEDTIRRMMLHPQISCAFACHNPNFVYGNNTLPVARAAGFPIKIDYVRNSVSTFVERLAQDGPNEHYFFTIAAFGTRYREMITRSASVPQVRRQAGQIELELAEHFPFQDFTQVGWTDLAGALTRFNGDLRAVGDGTSAASMVTYVVLITDGLQDFPRQNVPYNRVTNTDYESQCRALSREGQVEVFVIHAPTPYFDDPGYHLLIGPHQADARRKLQACASSENHFFVANDGPGIARAVETIAQRLSAMPRLTH